MLTKRRREAVLRDWRRRQRLVEPDAVPANLSDTWRVRPGRHRAPTPSMPLSATALATYPTRRLGIIGTVASIVCWLAMGLLPAFRIVNADVMGAERIGAARVIADAGVIGQSAFRVDPAEVAQRLTALPDVKAASVVLQLPRRVVIQVQETAPRLIWQSAGTAFAIDERAQAIPMPPDTQGLLTVSDRTGQLGSSGDRLPSGLLEAALAYAPAFGALTFESDHGFVATTKEGWSVWLGVDGRRAAEQAAMLDGLRASSASRGADFAYIDLRPAARPYFRLKGGR